MKRLLFVVGALLAFPHTSYAVPQFHFVTESDPGGLNNMNLFSFDSRTDLINFNTASSAPLPGLAPAVSMSGMTYDGNQYHFVTESDPGGLNNMNLFSFNSLNDLINFNTASSAPLPGLAPAVSMSGMTYDGSRYHFITESDPGGLNNVNLFSFDSLTDLINFNTASSAPMSGLASGVSISGLTFDGSQYHIVTESDPGGLNNMNLLSFDSLTDLINLSPANSAPMPGLAPAVSMSGLMFVPDPLQVPEPATAAFFAVGLAGMMSLRRRKGKTANFGVGTRIGLSES